MQSLRYLLSAVVLLSALDSGPSAHAGTVDPQGWTVLNPSPDSRVIYVSSSTGNDGNDGLSAAAPKRTIAAGFWLLRDGFPDQLCLRAGDVWSEFFPGWGVRGRSPDEMLVVRSYGPGPRPLIKTGTANSGISTFEFVANVALLDLHFIADGYDGTNATPVAIAMVGGPRNILIENCKVERYLTGMVIQGVGATQPSNIRLRRNVIADCYRVGLDIHTAGLYLDWINGLLLEENVIDHNGWREDIPNAVPTIFRRNVYIQSNCENVVTRGNIIARSAAEGMQQRPGGLCENNLFLKNTTALVFGKTGIVRNNVMLDSRDLDATSPMGGGINIDYANDVDVDGNVLAHRTTPATWNLGAIAPTHGSQSVRIRRNIIYNWYDPSAPQAMAIDIQTGTSATIEDNDFQMPNGVFVLKCTGTATFARNRYNSPNQTPFWTSAGFLTWPEWQAATGDNSAMVQVAYPDPNRTAATYAGLYGAVPTLEGFLAEARKQSRDNWRPEYTANAVNAHVRAGFGTGAPPVNHPPVILSGPFATPNPVIVNDPVYFSVSASDPDGDPLTYSWNFGDGSEGGNAETKHSFAAAGKYSVNVWISDGQGGVVHASVTVEVIASHADIPEEGDADDAGAKVVHGLRIKKLRRVVKANASGKDACSVSGELDGLPEGFVANGCLVTVDVGGATALLTLNAKGKSRTGNGKFSLSATRRGVAFTAVMRNGDWGAAWAAKDGRAVTVTVKLGRTVYKSEEFVKFRAATFKQRGLASSVEGGICY